MSYTRFPAPTKYENTPKANAYRAMRAAARLAAYLDRTQGTHVHSNTLEGIEWAEGYANEGETPDLGVYKGNWNGLDTYNTALRVREDLPGGRWPEHLGRRLERAGAEVEWCDEWSLCDQCNRFVRTEPDGWDYRPEFHVGHGAITCLSCLMDSVRGEDDVLEGIAEILWADVWADMAQKAGQSLSGCDILDVMDPVPEAAHTLAKTLWANFLHANRPRDSVYTPTCARILEQAMRADLHHETIPDFDDYARRFGQCVAYRAMGAGVSWEDDHEDSDLQWSSMFTCGDHRPALEDAAAECLNLVWDDEAVSDGGDVGDWVLADDE